MRITGKGIWGDPPDPEASKQLLKHVVELGVNFIDTAAAYEASERLIGEALALLPWSPLEAGRLAGRGGALEEVAAKHGATGSQVALAWLLQRSPAILVIPGTNSRAHLEENVAAAALRLDDADLEALAA